MNETIAQINHFLAESFGYEVDEIQTDYDLRGDFNVTELELLDFISLLEQAFDIEISAGEVRDLTTVSDLHELILDKLNEVS
jgi:acyl carrier protein